jgi:hypothetical protein
MIDGEIRTPDLLVRSQRSNSLCRLPGIAYGFLGRAELYPICTLRLLLRFAERGILRSVIGIFQQLTKHATLLFPW